MTGASADLSQQSRRRAGEIFPRRSTTSVSDWRDEDPYNYADVTVGRYNLYARRTDRDNETTRKKKKDKRKGTIHRRLKEELAIESDGVS